MSIKNLFISFLFVCVSFSFSYAQTVIEMEKDRGVYKVPCSINGLKLKFILDTGASNVSISSDIAHMMLENGYLNKEDFVGSGSSKIANGSIVEHTKINLKEMEIGGLVINDVEAVVIHNQSAPLLLGQSALEKFYKITISGNSLLIHGQNTKANIVNMSDDEINNALLKASNYRNGGFYILAAEIYKELYNLSVLSEYDILYYADCLFELDKFKEANQLYLQVLDNFKNNDNLDWSLIYSRICSCFFEMDNNHMCLKYSELFLSEFDFLDNNYLSCIELITKTYIKLGDASKALPILKKYVREYIDFHDIEPTDCWDKNYKDYNLGDIFSWFALVYHEINPSVFEYYLLISAAWGNISTIELCNKVDLNFSVKPYSYEYRF